MPKKLTAKQTLDRSMSENDLEDAAAALARTLGFMIFHPQRAQYENKKTGKRAWMTAYKGDKGFPDWVYAKTGKVLFVEFKTELGKTDEYQEKWLATLGALARLWRPSDLSSGLIEKTLRDW